MNKNCTRQLRVCSYNIHKGFSAMNTRYLLKEIRHAIQLVDADIVFLQEVVGGNLKRTRGSDDDNHLEFLSDTIWPHFSYGKNAVYQKGHHGNAILSKHPIRFSKNISITHWSFSQRGILLAELNNGTYLLCLHFGLLQQEREKQLSTMLRTINTQIPAAAPLLIAGDFNDWNGRLHRVIELETDLKEAYFESHGRLARTFPAITPIFSMDRIYYRNLDLIEVDVMSGNPWGSLSDHCALNAIFNLQ
jgi:endonuclease/exonuclease/phosphatase family metal-dependent hydrolase